MQRSIVTLSACNGDPDQLVAQRAPDLAREFTATTTFTFAWTDVVGETESRLLEGPVGASVDVLP